MSDKNINIGRALAFNTLTTGLAAGGFAYTEEKFGNAGLPDWLFIGLIVVFSLAFIFGVLVAGEAAGFDENTKDTTGGSIVTLGRLHSFFFAAGSCCAGRTFRLVRPQCLDTNNLRDRTQTERRHRRDNRP
jgi:hypothetical protein